MLIVKALLIVVVAGMLVFGVRWLLSRTLPRESREHAEKAIPFLLGSISGFYGLIAGFMLSNSYAEVRSLHGAMTAEVSALVELARIARNLPPPMSEELMRGTEDYLRTVINSELPALVQGHWSQETTDALERLWRLLGQYRPTSEWDGTMRTMALNKIVDVGEQRRLRILASRDRMPMVVWYVLLFGGGVVVVGACVASLQHGRPAGVFLGALTAIVTLVLMVIFVLQQPFRYGVATGVDDYGILWQVFGGQLHADSTPASGAHGSRR